MVKVSVIMGIYNCEKTLSEAIESICNQTYKNWELIMCDDGSTDNTYELAKSFQEEYPEKIVLIKNKINCGLNHTLNKCLKIARGEYIARMDGDDISLQERIEKEVEFLDIHPEYDIVSTPMIYFDEHGDWGRSYSIEKPEKKDFIKNSPVFCHAPCMVRKEAFQKVNGYTEDRRMLRFEDVNLWYKLYAAGYKGYNLEEPLYKMRDDINATKRRTLRSRMNGVYVMYVGFKMFEYPWYMYIYVFQDFIKHFIKGILPEKVYMSIHRRRIQKW